MAVDNGYTTFAKLKSFFHGAPIERILSQSEIETEIDEWGLEVERLSGLAWRAVTETDEHHTISNNVSTGPHFNIYAIHLKKNFLRSVTKLEIFDGDDFVDWIATGKTEGRSDDYFLDKENGIIYVNAYRFIYYGWDARITYVWGKSSVDKDARDLNLRYVARHLMSMPNFFKTVPEAKGGKGDSAWDRNEKRIEQLENRMANTFGLINTGGWQ